MNFVGSDLEGMQGVFEYYPNWNSLAAFGFWPVEVHEACRQNLISQKEARMYIRFIPDDVKAVCFLYSVSVPLGLLKKDLKIKIVLEGEEYVTSITSESGYIEVPILKKHKHEDIISVVIHSEILWIPDKLIHNNDNRMQGICVNEVKYITE